MINVGKALLTAGCVIASCAAARVTLRSIMTVAKTRSRLRSSVRKFTDTACSAGAAFAPVIGGFRNAISQ